MIDFTFNSHLQGDDRTHAIHNLAAIRTLSDYARHNFKENATDKNMNDYLIQRYKTYLQQIRNNENL